ncbi:MAG: hypothetical protein AMXMBFR13_43680 [Phycisphaerae bacterium]|jgi:hypothetical protein
MSMQTEFSANTKVKVAQTGPPPDDVKCVKDVSVNPRTRKQLMEGFWKNHRGISGRVAFIPNDSDRERLRREGKVMVQISDLSAQHITVIVPRTMLLPG